MRRGRRGRGIDSSVRERERRKGECRTVLPFLVPFWEILAVFKAFSIVNKPVRSFEKMLQFWR